MTTRMLPRLGAGCGAVFSVALFAAHGNGNPGYARTVVGLFALAFFLPFLAYLCSLLREAEGENGWLATTAFAAGLTGITIKLMSGAPEIAYRHVADRTPAHRALEGIAEGATVTYDLGGNAGTSEFATAIVQRLEAGRPAKQPTASARAS